MFIYDMKTNQKTISLLQRINQVPFKMQPSRFSYLASESTKPLNPFRASCIKVYVVDLPLKKMQSKFKYVVWCEESDVRPEKTYFQVYA
jgi:hypothetical protein